MNGQNVNKQRAILYWWKGQKVNKKIRSHIVERTKRRYTYPVFFEPIHLPQLYPRYIPFGMHLAGIHTAGIRTHHINTGGIHTGGIHTGGIHTPGIHTPGIHTPGIHTPGIHTTGIHTYMVERTRINIQRGIHNVERTKCK